MNNNANTTKFESVMNKVIIPILEAQNGVYNPLDHTFLKGLIDQNHVEHALDIGTGEGSFILDFARKTPRVKYNAIDANAELISYAQKNKNQYEDKQVTFDCTFFNKTYPIDDFDLILARFSLEHTDDLDGLIQAVFQKLCHKGLFAIIEYYIDDGIISDPVWRAFKRREMATYKTIKSHPRIIMDLPMLLSRSKFENIKSSLLQISPSTVGAEPFYHLALTEAQTCAKIAPLDWTETFLDQFEEWCHKMTKEGKEDPMFFLTHTVGQKP